MTVALRPKRLLRLKADAIFFIVSRRDVITQNSNFVKGTWCKKKTVLCVLIFYYFSSTHAYTTQSQHECVLFNTYINI